MLQFVFGRMRFKKHSEKTKDDRPKREQRKRERASSGTRKSAALSRLVAKRLLARLARARKFVTKDEEGKVFAKGLHQNHHHHNLLLSWRRWTLGPRSDFQNVFFIGNKYTFHIEEMLFPLRIYFSPGGRVWKELRKNRLCSTEKQAPQKSPRRYFKVDRRCA